MFLHNSSINFTIPHFPSPLMMFLHKMQSESGKTSRGGGKGAGTGRGGKEEAKGNWGEKVFVMDSAMVSPIMLLLSGGQVEVHPLCKLTDFTFLQCFSGDSIHYGRVHSQGGCGAHTFIISADRT